MTATHENPEIIRVWIERSKTNVPLDIEIFLEVPLSHHRLRRPPPSPPGWSPPMDGWYNDSPPTPPLVPSSVQSQSSNSLKLGMHNEIPQLQPHQSNIIATIARYNDSTSSNNANKHTHSTVSGSWGHIVFFYLSQQMHRWKRFVFRFERKFDSLKALQYLSGRALFSAYAHILC